MKATILFTQAKGGAGKTTLMTQLAAHWLVAGHRVAMIDLDPQRSAAAWLAARAEAGGRAMPVHAAQSADWRAASDIREAAGAADLVLVDTAGHAEALGGVIRDRADLVVIPCQPSMADVLATSATLTTVRAGRTPYLVVLNRCPARSRAAAAAEAALARHEAPMAAARLGQRAAYAEAFMLGLGAGEMPGASKAAEEVAALAQEIAARLAP